MGTKKIKQKEKLFITNLYSALQTAQNEGYNHELCPMLDYYSVHPFASIGDASQIIFQCSAQYSLH